MENTHMLHGSAAWGMRLMVYMFYNEEDAE